MPRCRSAGVARRSSAIACSSFGLCGNVQMGVANTCNTGRWHGGQLEACTAPYATPMGEHSLPSIMAALAQNTYTADGAQMSRLGGDLGDAILWRVIPHQN
jgi:hypothetical protein